MKSIKGVCSKMLEKQKGASMIETLGVLAVLGMIGVSTIKFIGAIYDKFIQNMVIAEARDLQKSISDRYRFEGNYATLFSGRTCEGTDSVADFLCGTCDDCNERDRLVPFQMCKSGKIIHRGGGDVQICEYEEETDKYYMIYYGLTKTVCAALAQVDWHTRQKSEIYQVVINPGKSSQLAINSSLITGTTGNSFPITANQAHTACSEEINTIQFVFF